MESHQDPFKEEIVEPSDSIIDQLIRTDIDYEGETPLSSVIPISIDNVYQRVSESETRVIDIIGAQMEVLSEEFQDCITATQQLFLALTKLKEAQVAIMQDKTTATASLVRNIETTMGCIRKIGIEK